MWLRTHSLRTKILSTVLFLVLVCLAGSVLALLQVTAVQEELTGLQGGGVPGARLLEQLQKDYKVLEASDTPAAWMIEAIDRDYARLLVIAASLQARAPDWRAWREKLQQEHSVWERVKVDASELVREGPFSASLGENESLNLKALRSRLRQNETELGQTLQQSAAQFDRTLSSTLDQNMSRVRSMKAGLEMILAVVLLLSLSILWVGDRALRPLAQLTHLAREITTRGVRREDKAVLAGLMSPRRDEVGTLATEFRRMATALLERERQIDTQNARLKDSNRLLQEMGELNRSLFQSVQSFIVVTDPQLRIKALNPMAERGMAMSSDTNVCLLELANIPMDSVEAGTTSSAGTQQRPILRELFRRLEDRLASLVEAQVGGSQSSALGTQVIQGRVLRTRVLVLQDEASKAEDSAQSMKLRAPSKGLVFWIEDLTDEQEMQERLGSAEKLAAVARMSAQVAHEIRNPLHSIGLEVEVALENNSSKQVEQSLRSIAQSVERLDQMTHNYLTLTRTSAGKKEATDLVEVLCQVLATYGAQCEASGIRVDWEHPSSAWVWGDNRLLEQALGNLMKNSIQALESSSLEPGAREIRWSLKPLETGRIRVLLVDNGPGVSDDVADDLFVPFVTTKAEGTGLGLSFVKQVIEGHDGTVQWLKSSGATFEILLPGIEHDPFLVQESRSSGEVKHDISDG